MKFAISHRIVRRILTLIVVLFVIVVVTAEDQQQGGDDYYDSGDDGNLQAWDGSDDKFEQTSNGEIKYWTDYAIYPKRCIRYNNVDVIVYSMHNTRAKQCTNDPLGTYYLPVPNFLGGYIQQKYQDASDQGLEYSEPEVLQYAYCVGYYIQNVLYYLQVGCTDGTTQSISIQIYQDKECTVRSVDSDGYDDTNFDTSEIQINFKKCQNCVNWFDMDAEVDDGFFKKRMTDAPMCSTAWSNKQTCDRKCQHIGIEKKQGAQGWNTSDHLLLGIIGLFALIMLALIIRKRQKMSNKDALLEQAALSAAGLQQPHIIGMFVLTILVVAVFALLGLKDITWALLLVLNTVLFGYLMKLTIDSSSTTETIVCPDGTVMLKHVDDDDDSDDDSESMDHHTMVNTPVTTATATTAGFNNTTTNYNSNMDNSTAAEYVENRASATSYVLPTLD